MSKNFPTHDTKQPTFQLKGTMLAITVFELTHFNIERLTQELSKKTKEAPDFFETIPMVLAIDKLDISLSKIELKGLVSLFKEYHIQLMALRTDNQAAIDMAHKLGLAILPPTGAREKLIELAASKPAITEKEVEQPKDDESNATEQLTEQPSNDLEKNIENTQPILSDDNDEANEENRINEQEETSTKADEHPIEETTEVIKQVVFTPSKLITTPVRSGQQIEHDTCDLIITSNISTGAEVMTNGNIHIYGTMRGRAMAGYQGNDKARVFCHKLTAELISIAGQIITEEELRHHPLWGKAAQVSLENNQITISAL